MSKQLASHPQMKGRSISKAEAEDIGNYAQDAKPLAIFLDDPDKLFIYKIVEKEGWNDKVDPIIISWIRNADNMDRAGTCVLRDPTAIKKKVNDSVDIDNGKLPHDIVYRRCLAKFSDRGLNDFAFAEKLAVNADDIPIDAKQTIVFIALRPLSAGNGFFASLEAEEDICLDGKTPVQFSPSQLPRAEDGLAVFFSLAL